MHEYYRRQTLLPTFADLRGEPELARYAELRAAVLRDRGGLPPAFFAGKEIVEIGPDSGENALVFAAWGAHLTLVEPNERAHGPIRDYFERFGLADALRAVHAADALSYQSDERYDVVVAEGFIYTVKPTTAWLEVFHRLLRPDGLFIVTYYERFGALIELALGALQRAYRGLTGRDAATAAGELYRAKWDSIPHTRAFESWVMDVLENPFVTAANCLDARTFVDEMSATGFDLYASHPHYDDVLHVEWLKRIVTPGERAERARRHLAHSTLSFLAGRKLYLAEGAVATLADRTAQGVIDAVDRVRGGDAGAAGSAAEGFGQLAEIARTAAVVVDDVEDRRAAVAFFESFARAFALVVAGDAAGLAHHTMHDPAFIAGWGLPVHLAVGRAR